MQVKEIYNPGATVSFPEPHSNSVRLLCPLKPVPPELAVLREGQHCRLSPTLSLPVESKCLVCRCLEILTILFSIIGGE